MKIFLDDSQCREKLFPFTHTRHVADIRIGILTIREKWQRLTGKQVENSIGNKNDNSFIIKANILPAINNFQFVLDAVPGNFNELEFPWQIFQYNEREIKSDYDLITQNRESQPLRNTNSVIGNNIFIEEGAFVEHSILNASTGPIYIGKNATIMEGSMIRGPFALCEGATVKMGSRIYGATTIGPYCVAGGEIKNSVMFGYSNKAHDGYLGDSVLGEWCNLGAGTSNSNLKNTVGEVRYKTSTDAEAMVAGTKGGLLMGDYSRAAINTSFNTGTVVGVCCNIFGQSFPEKYIANFSWGSEKYDLEKALKDISNWKMMKGQSVSENEKELLRQLYLSNE